MVLTVKDIENTQKELYEHSVKQAKKKGNDYSGNSVDTFRNIRSAKYFNVVKSDAQACMVQILNKVARMSNQSDPNFITEIKDESIFDTVSDLWNYSSYWLMLMREMKSNEIEKNFESSTGKQINRIIEKIKNSTPEHGRLKVVKHRRGNVKKNEIEKLRLFNGRGNATK